MNKRDLTLIIPCHNLERYLAPLLSTLQNQELHDLKVEILFICDSCSDNTFYILDDWRNKTPQYEVYIFETSYSRAGLARNFGLERAQGEYLWFIDGDDWLIGEDAILTAYYNIDSHPNLSFLRFGFLSTWCPKPEFENTVVWRFIFRTDFVRQFKFNDKLNNEDVDFLNQIFQNFQEGIGIPNKLYFYNYKRKNSLTTNLQNSNVKNQN